ncbi:MAG: diguanylate cyclase with sensor [Holophagaceae bacterium]|nr:diguanylate cyclase with sensor [Holophagaceae bacterium]
MQDDTTSLQELLALLANRSANASLIFQEGLALIVRATGVDRAMLALKSPYELETVCWATAEGPAVPEWLSMPATSYCHATLAAAPAPLIIPDTPQDPIWNDSEAIRELGIHAYLGVPLCDPPAGVLSLQSATSQAFQPRDILCAQGVAALFTRIIEAGQLREDLHRKEEILALHSAVADDHAMENPHSMLPTRRYLEVWIRANLSRARRSGEKIGVAIFDSRRIPDEARNLENLLQHLRGEDILVDLGNHEILLAAPSSNRKLMDGLLRRVQTLLGIPIPLGVTLCDPETDHEGGKPSLEPAIERARRASMEIAEGADEGTRWSMATGT